MQQRLRRLTQIFESAGKTLRKGVKAQRRQGKLSAKSLIFQRLHFLLLFCAQGIGAETGGAGGKTKVDNLAGSHNRFLI